MPRKLNGMRKSPGAAARRIALFEMRYLWVRARVSPARDIQC
jgi:hypothetical protein